MRVALISDTHIPSRAAELPAWVVQEVEAADQVIHAGDFDSPEAYGRIRDLAAALSAVHGNMDPRTLGPDAVETVVLGGVQFVITHGTGPLAGYRERVASTVDDHAASDRPTVGVSGHTHEVIDRELRGYRVLNPGSATGAAPAETTSMMVARVEAGEIDVELLYE